MDCLQKTVPHQNLYSTATETYTNPNNPYNDYTSSTINFTISNNKNSFPCKIIKALSPTTVSPQQMSRTDRIRDEATVDIDYDTLNDSKLLHTTT